MAQARATVTGIGGHRMPLDIYMLRDFWGLVVSQPSMFRYRRLQRQFGFHPWHVQSPYSRRSYKARVVRLVNAQEPETVVEIGCGLGEIVARTRALYRHGFDRELAAVAAATVPHGHNTHFHHGELHRPEDIARLVGRPIDVIVAVNWPHMLPIEEIDHALARLHQHLPLHVLIIDTIRPDRQGYEHYHSISDVARLGTILTTHSGGDGIRDLHVVKLHKRVVIQ